MPSVAKKSAKTAAAHDDAVPDELSNYLALIPPIFTQAQHTLSNHRKNVVSLRKIQEKCAKVTAQSPKGTMLVGEKAFNSKFIDCLERILPVKKGVTVADRIVAFVGRFMAYTTSQGTEIRIPCLGYLDKLLTIQSFRRERIGRRGWTFSAVHHQAIKVPHGWIQCQRQVCSIQSDSNHLHLTQWSWRDR